MDGAARFNQRDAIATILITGINIVAGFLIGVFQLDIPFREALKTYTVLTVGDGLVTMIPSLRSRWPAAWSLPVPRRIPPSPPTLASNSSRRRSSLNCRRRHAGAGHIPGMAEIFFYLHGRGVAFPLAWRLQKLPDVIPQSCRPKPRAPKKTGTVKADSLDALLSPRRSLARSRLRSGRAGRCQAGRTAFGPRQSLRNSLASQLGFIVPRVHITDNLRLRPRNRHLPARRRNRPLGNAGRFSPRDQLRPRAAAPAGIATREPAFGVAARWIAPELREQAIAAGYSVVDQTSVLATHISRVIRQYAYELLTRAETKRLLERLNDSHPKLLDELVPKLMTLGEVQRVLQQLLREQVSIRDLGAILETLVEAAPISKNLVPLVEACRQALGRSLIKPLLNDQGELKRDHSRPSHRGGAQPGFHPADAGLGLACLATHVHPPAAGSTCVSWSARTSTWPRRSFSARSTRASICAVYWSHFFPKSSSFRTAKFLRSPQCIPSGASIHEPNQSMHRTLP